MEQMAEALKGAEDWKTTIMVDDGGRMVSCWMTGLKVKNCDYPRDLRLVHDTSCANFHGTYLSAMIVEDENAVKQLLSCGLISSRERSILRAYFEEMKRQVSSIRLFICNRNTAQTNAMTSVWPDCTIQYCLAHIIRNRRDKVKDPSIIQKFAAMCQGRASEAEVMAAMEQ